MIDSNDTIDTIATERSRRFDNLVRDLRPRVRILHPTLTDDQVMEKSVRMAALRLQHEEFIWVER